MADKVILNNISDDAQSKQYISNVLMPKVFHDIPMNVLNTGAFSIINEYMSQAMEQMGFTSSFYFNESFITKAVLPDSIYSEAAIFNIGYAYATPSASNFLLELKIEDIYKNAKYNPDNSMYEFILDKNTKFNLSNGNVYSLDYDILIQYMNIPTSDNQTSIPAWNVQYIKTDDMNSVAINKDTYLLYRVTDIWLCIFVKASEYVRETHTVVMNMTNGVPNQDTIITCENHICGFDIKYTYKTDDNTTITQWIPHDHILAIHADIYDQDPYVHYIMDNPQTIRFMYQLCGNRYWIPKQNSKLEITVYTCHGESANFTDFTEDEQPMIITESNRYPNNGNVMKTSFVLSGSTGGKDIGNVETVRRQTIEAYNTANVISTDHDIQEWFKTFFFKNVLYPFFYKRRDDPWGRIWAGFMALKDNNNEVFRTNTLHMSIPYRILYSNNGNDLSNNEIIIPPGWLWVYGNNRYTVVPYTKNNNIIEYAENLSSIPNSFLFANPFGIRVQKQPFSIGYFNPWVNKYTPVSHVDNMNVNKPLPGNEANMDDPSNIYHATPLVVNVRRTYLDDYYNVLTYINQTITQWVDGRSLISQTTANATVPTFVSEMWEYFNKPSDLYSTNIPIRRYDQTSRYLPYNVGETYLCVKEKNVSVDGTYWTLNNIWIEDYSSGVKETILIPIPKQYSLVGPDSIWGDNTICEGISYDDDVSIGLSPAITDQEPITFNRIENGQYYAMMIDSSVSQIGVITKIVASNVYETDLTKYGETRLYRIGSRYMPVSVNIYFRNNDTEHVVRYTITNAAQVLIPYTPTVDDNGNYVFTLDQVGASGVVLYADMKPSQATGSFDHYRVRFSDVNYNEPMFFVRNNTLDLSKNNMRVILHALRNGNQTGWIEMLPVKVEPDGSYRYETKMYPLNKLIDIDKSIHIASTTNGGGAWTATNEGTPVTVDAEEPEFMISILIKSTDENFKPGPNATTFLSTEYDGYRVVDQYTLDDISMLQELKEMRSVVNWGETTEPTEGEIRVYNELFKASYPSDQMRNFYDIRTYMHDRLISHQTQLTFSDLKETCRMMSLYVQTSLGYIQPKVTMSDSLKFISDLALAIGNIKTENDLDILTVYEEMTGKEDATWEDVYIAFDDTSYVAALDETFKGTNVNGGLEIQLSPFVSAELMVSEKFVQFVTAFADVHKSIEPVLFNRLEGNNYLDCKLIATYGLPHSYTSDVDKNIEDSYWPDLSVQIEFDVKLYNNAIGMNTINELKIVIKDYFNRLTSIHTPIDVISMDNNIYISNLIDQMKDNENVAYLKFKGWYTNDKGHGGKYMNADYQAIVQKWDKIDDMPTDELTRFVPEMFVLNDDNIVLNII